MILPAAIGKRALDRRLLTSGPEHHTRAAARADRNRIPTVCCVSQATRHHAANISSKKPPRAESRDWQSIAARREYFSAKPAAGS